MILLKALLYMAVFLNCWIAGRSFAATDTDIPSLLRAVVAVAGYNVFIMAGFLLATFN